MLTITSRGCIFFLSPPPHFGVVTLPRERTPGTSDDYRTAARVRCLLTRRDGVAASGANDEDRRRSWIVFPSVRLSPLFLDPLAVSYSTRDPLARASTREANTAR